MKKSKFNPVVEITKLVNKNTFNQVKSRAITVAGKKATEILQVALKGFL